MSDRDTLISMGFEAQKVNLALSKTGNAGLQPALDWLISNPNFVDVADQVISEAVEDTGEISIDQQTAQSLKCDDCGRLLRDGSAAEQHAIKTSHQNFSESLSAIKALTAEEKAVKVKELQARLLVRKEAKRVAETEDVRVKENFRRASGAEMQLIKEKMEEDEIKKGVIERKYLKEQDRLAKEKVRARLEEDKAQRRQEAEARRLAREGKEVPVIVKQHQPLVLNNEYPETRIQIRLPTGQPITHTFKATEQFVAVIDFCRLHHQADFKLLQSFPRKLFDTDSHAKTLKELNLTPSASLILQ